MKKSLSDENRIGIFDLLQVIGSLSLSLLEGDEACRGGSVGEGARKNLRNSVRCSIVGFGSRNLSWAYNFSNGMLIATHPIKYHGKTLSKRIVALV